MSKANIIAGAHIKNFSEIIKPTKEEIEDKRKENKIISSKIKNCIFCNTKFNYGRSSRLSCGLCKIKYYCEYCGKEIIVPICKTNSRTQSNIYKLIQENNIKSYKSCCSTAHSRLLYNKNQSKPGVCRKCKEYSKIRNSFGLCPECTGRSKETICIKCGGESNKLDTTGRCPKCASKSGEGKCAKCKQEKNNLNAFGICSECSPIKPLFLNNNSCMYHKNQKLTYKGDCWECFKDKFNKNNIIPGDFAKYNPIWQNTYRLQRTNKIGQLAMEQELVDRGINWFVYIKFYEIENKIKPLQVCKSGSMIVNKSGSDVGFSTNINHGAARIFLNENNLRWHIEKILIFPTKTEKEAYELERLLIKRFGLFSS